MNRRGFLTTGIGCTLASAAGCLTFQEADEVETTGSESTGVEETARTTAAAGNETETASVSGGTRDWAAETLAPVTGPPALGDETVYVHSSDRHLYAFDRATGDRLWRTELGDPSSGAGASRRPHVSDEIVVGSTVDGIYAVERSSGGVRWTASGSWADASPVIVNSDTVTYLADTGTLRGVNLATGAEQWVRSFGERALALAQPLADGSAFVLTGERDTSNCSLRSVELEGGAEQSRTELEIANTVGYRADFAFVVDGTAVTNVDGDTVAGFDAETGDRVWARTYSEGVTPMLTVDGSAVYTKGTDEEVGQDAIDVETGDRLWEFSPDGEGRCCRVAPAVGNDTVFFPNTGGLSLAGVDAVSGELRWRFEGEADTESTPAVAADAIYVGAQDGSLYRIKR